MTSTESKTETQRAKVWITPEQVEKLRNAAYATGATYLQSRNEALVALMADTGIRVGELVALDVHHLKLNEGEVFLPTEIQKDYPIKGKSPPPVHLDLADDTVRTLRAYLNSRWKDSDAVFPSRQSDRMTTEQVRNVVRTLAKEADVEPHRVDGGRGVPADIGPHSLRHSVAYRMLRVKEGNRLIDVRDRLRHSSIQTTERVYEHFKRR
jgi:integrase/recombinase XerC/integrase/recombinase XerD